MTDNDTVQATIAKHRSALEDIADSDLPASRIAAVLMEVGCSSTNSTPPREDNPQ